MGRKIWEFIGLPDPDKNTVQKKVVPSQKMNRITKPENPESIEEDEVVPKQLPNKSLNWDGPLTPEGDPFHDLGFNTYNTKNELPSKALRYVTPNSMNRLPLDSMVSRLYQGDVVIVDLSVMVHMDAHQRACRQSLRQLSNERRMPIFSLDDKDCLLMLPGNNVRVDVSKYDLV